MKKFIASIAVFTLIVCYLCSCEKDDICADGTPTTPSLIIEFYNKDNQEILKTINLEYFAEGFTDVDTITNSRLELPLRVDADNVKWSMTYVYTPTAGNVIRNTDFMEFNYERNELYVSRPCEKATDETNNKMLEKYLNVCFIFVFNVKGFHCETVYP